MLYQILLCSHPKIFFAKAFESDTHSISMWEQTEFTLLRSILIDFW